FFFFSSRRRHTRFSRDWSSDVCSSDLDVVADPVALAAAQVSLGQLRDALRESTGAVAGTSLPAGPGQALLRGVFWPTRTAELGRSEERRVGESVGIGGRGLHRLHDRER